VAQGVGPKFKTQHCKKPKIIITTSGRFNKSHNFKLMMSVSDISKDL
jgi:hypothetical protein